jgi:hypothetical protein
MQWSPSTSGEGGGGRRRSQSALTATATSSLHVSSQGGSSVDEYLDQIQRERTSLKTLSIELFLELGDHFWVDQVPLTAASPTTQLLQASAGCHRLDNLQLYSPRATSVDIIPLLFQCWTATTPNPLSRLTSLSITRSVRFDTVAHVEMFAAAIRTCHHLSDFKLVHPHCETIPIDALVCALAELPLLQSIDITLFNNSHAITTTTTPTTAAAASSSDQKPHQDADTTFVSVASLHKLLLQSPRLTALSLWGCGINDHHLPLLQNSQLSFLSLRRNPQINEWKPFYHSLMTNFALKALYNDHADLMSCLHPSLPHHSPETDETAAICAAEVCLALNRLGRGEGDDDESFLDLIESVNDSSLALYILLRSRPGVWCERRSSHRKSKRAVLARIVDVGVALESEETFVG